MQTTSRSLRAFAFVTGVAMLGFSPWALADPPSRVARLGYISGAVSFSPAGESDWVHATLNRPLTPGDRLWADANSRVEIQVGGAMIRMSAGTSVSILNFDDRIAQLQLTQGALNVRVRRLEPDQAVEIATPNLAFTIRQAGAYRIEVDPAGTATTIVVRNGRGEVYGEGASYVIDSRQPYRFTGTDLREYRQVEAPRLDEFDRWSGDRDRGYDNSVSARYVSQDVVGYQDLDAHGTWRVDATYGNVWFPSRVGAGWAPYRDGHWAWVDPWGWTWVDDAPWGFAVSHYGRWTNLRGTWGWVPGPVRTRAYYAPALVAFVGGDNFQFSLSAGGGGGIGWFPLGPREVYRPSYAVSRGYFENVNRSNTVINATVINNYYNNPNVSNVVYANQSVPGAVVAVPTTVFAQSQPVSTAAVRVRQEAIASAPVAVMPSIAPTERSVRGGAPSASGTPPSRAFERPVVAHTPPPAAVPGFSAQQQQLQAKPGTPLDEATRRQLKPAAAPVQAPVVKVVEQTQKAPAAMLPPPVQSAPQSPTARPAEQPGRTEQRGNAEQRVPPVAPAPAPQRAPGPEVVAPPAVAPQSGPRPPTAQPAEQRGRAEQRGNAEQRVPPVAPAPAPQRAPGPEVVAPPAVAPQSGPRPPTAQPAEQRGRAEQRGNAEQRVPPVAPAPAPQRAPGPEVVAPPAVAPQSGPRPPTAQPAEQRGRSEQRGNAEQRVPPAVPTPPPQRAVEPKAVAPQPAAAAPANAPPPQQAAPPKAASPGQSAPSAPVAQQPAQKAKPQPAPDAEPPKPAAEKSKKDKDKDGDDPNREEDGRKPKR